jgi:hypothetical protein
MALAREILGTPRPPGETPYDFWVGATDAFSPLERDPIGPWDMTAADLVEINRARARRGGSAYNGYMESAGTPAGANTAALTAAEAAAATGMVQTPAPLNLSTLLLPVIAIVGLWWASS